MSARTGASRTFGVPEYRFEQEGVMPAHAPYPRDTRVISGLPVRFHSYRAAGNVGRVTDEAFELVRPAGERLWLPYDAVFGVSYAVRLICEEPGLTRLRLRSTN